MSFSRDDLDRARLESARALLVDSEDPEAASWAAELAGASGVPVVLDAGQSGEGGFELFSKVDFPIVSAEFAEWAVEFNAINIEINKLENSLSDSGIVVQSGKQQIKW